MVYCASRLSQRSLTFETYTISTLYKSNITHVTMTTIIKISYRVDGKSYNRRFDFEEKIDLQTCLNSVPKFIANLHGQPVLIKSFSVTYEKSLE